MKLIVQCERQIMSRTLCKYKYLLGMDSWKWNYWFKEYEGFFVFDFCFVLFLDS